MKLDALEHPKTLDLASRLDAGLPATIGHLELLWAFTGKYAPAGDIGRHSDGAIARACHWTGRPELFTQALREAGFIDASSKHRLTIHDWQDHAPRWVKSKLKTLGQAFVAVVSSPVDTGGDTSGDTSQDVTDDSKCREEKRSEEKPEALARGVPGLDRESWEKWLAYRKSSGKPIKPPSMVEAARKMAALGSQQQTAVSHSIANSYQGLYLPKDAPRGTSPPTGRQSNIPDERELEQLRRRAERVGFRARNPSESLPGYETLLQRAELAARDGSGPQRAVPVIARSA